MFLNVIAQNTPRISQHRCSSQVVSISWWLTSWCCPDSRHWKFSIHRWHWVHTFRGEIVTAVDKKLGNTWDFCFQIFERLNFRAKNFLGQTNIGQRKPNYLFMDGILLCPHYFYVCKKIITRLKTKLLSLERL